MSHWYSDESWHDSLVRLVSQPTINIEGLVGGYTGPGGKTILPHRAVAKIDMRLVPDMTAKDTLELIKKHLAKHGFGDIEVNMTGGYDPTETPADSKLVKAMVATYQKAGDRSAALAAARGIVARRDVHRARRSSCPRDSSGSATAPARTRRTSTG